jgi:hypothetical protein
MSRGSRERVYFIRLLQFGNLSFDCSGPRNSAPQSRRKGPRPLVVAAVYITAALFRESTAEVQMRHWTIDGPQGFRLWCGRVTKSEPFDIIDRPTNLG